MRLSKRPETRDSLPHDLALVGGAYDGLSATLIERAGFDAVWASGFSISASKCLPDCSVMTPDDLVDRVAEMTRAVTIPVIADGDEGYGDLRNTEELASRLAGCGAAGICIEDSGHPKLNSFFGEPRRTLADLASYTGKLRAIRRAAPSLALIARTESLIAGEPLAAAVERATRYADCGVDFVLIHSRFTQLGEFRALAQAWTGSVPLAVIPTLAEDLPWRSLMRLGFRMVIYANQALRASVQAQELTLREIRDSPQTHGFQQRLASLEHIFGLTGLSGKAQSPASGE